ncbi:hypothetical protein B9G53_14140 [Pseudanabaena sp. SR411]|uniref:HNH endonuclease n=1 Tax=Pseudanabaena sp. SR411 TaxID=1980935 RepID=UPI000B98BB76|nr:hypothetical protein [Pseudanabaena sp. SR411]OYQ63944.1 hypothetical protein B9G53_14140 [Pseudanabaena sp. SR411]
MRKLAKPIDDVGEVFLACISGFRNHNLKSRLSSVKIDIVSAAVDFELAASSNTLHTLIPQNDINGIVTKQEMLDVYTNGMVSNSLGRKIYDKLLAGPVHGRCPLCGQGRVKTLDHHLPKSLYPALAVVPANLIPSCSDCNKAKLDAKPISAEYETIHPYFDDIESDLWLHARVIEESPTGIQFFVKIPENWNNVKSKRVKHHFKTFKLSSLYTSLAADEISGIRYYLTQLFSKTGYQGVKEHLSEEAISREKVYLNSWQTAMYKALTDSYWYCSGGFK